MKVLLRVTILRVVAATDVSARATQAQVHPRVAGAKTLLAAARVPLIRLYAIEV
jgi:hypothetical protein